MGSCTVNSIHGKTASLPLVVVKGDGISLLGRNWLEEIKLDWCKIVKINGILIKKGLTTSLNSMRRH